MRKVWDYPLICWGILLFASIILHNLCPMLQLLTTNTRKIGGIIFLILGAVVGLYGLLSMAKKKVNPMPTTTPTALVTGGAYQFSRHPMYLGLLLAKVSLFLFLGSLASLLSPISFFLLCQLYFIPKEENTLEKLFGLSFLDYKKKVPKWI